MSGFQRSRVKKDDDVDVEETTVVRTSGLEKKDLVGDDADYDIK